MLKSLPVTLQATERHKHEAVSDSGSVIVERWAKLGVLALRPDAYKFISGAPKLSQNCASSPDKFFILTSANQIVTTFAQIGTNLSKLRIAK